MCIRDSVSIRGGNEKTSFYTSLSYKNAKSTTENNTFERYSMLLKAVSYTHLDVYKRQL